MTRSPELGFRRADCCRRIFEVVPRQLDLARMLGLTPSAISNTKKRKQCSLELVIAASKITGRPIEWFLFGEEGQKGGAAPGAPVAAESKAGYGGTGTAQAALRTYDERLAGLERSVRRLERRVDQLEGGGSGA